MKLIISFLLLILLSCEPTSKDEVLNKIEDTKIKIKKKTINKLKENKESKKIIKKNKNIEKNIFYLVGEPYFIEGVKYIPEENYSYSEIGLATFYDKDLHNKRTVNNDLNKVTELLGRHKTLPIPCIVKITNLENGLSLNIKVVDRHRDNASIIQVSRKAAQLLRFYNKKVTKVKVEILSDPEKGMEKCY
jgi:Lipoproteins